MQCLCAPTCNEVDSSHARGGWLDIGLLSFRNLINVRKSRACIAVVLALSSVPLHLLYNSAVFKTTDNSIYDVAVANPDWLLGGNFSTAVFSDYLFDEKVEAATAMQHFFAQNSHNASRVANLTNQDCISTYATEWLSGYANLLLVSNDPDRDDTANATLLSFDLGGSDAPINWDRGWRNLCPNQDPECTMGSLKAQPQDWTVGDHRIAYCLAEVIPSHCKLQFSTQIMMAVICMNLMKVVCMFWTLRRQKEQTLVTLGDALTSFLDRPDGLTRGRCLMTKSDVANGPLRWQKEDDLYQVDQLTRKTDTYLGMSSRHRLQEPNLAVAHLPKPLPRPSDEILPRKRNCHAGCECVWVVGVAHLTRYP